MSTITFNVDYVLVDCGKDGCSQSFAMSRRFYDETKRTGHTWYCPSGHPRAWRGKSTEQKLREAEAQATHLTDQLQASAHEAERLRQALLRDRHRFSNGVCPCCNRSFENVARHIRGQHPDYDISRVEGAAAMTFECSCGRSFESLRGLRTHQGHQRDNRWHEPNRAGWAAHRTVVSA